MLGKLRAGMRDLETLHQRTQRQPLRAKRASHRARESWLELAAPLEQSALVGYRRERGRRRRRRAQICHEVRDGHIDLMAHARYRRHAARRDRTRDALIVEAPEILERAAAPR